MSEAHRRHVMSQVDKINTPPPANPQRTISRSTRDVLDGTSLSVDHRHNPDAAAERKYLKRKAALEANGVPRTTGKNAGAFDKLRAGLRDYVRANGGAEHMAKAVPSSNDDGLDQAALIRQLKAGPKAAPKGSLLKSLAPAFDKAAKSLGVANPLKKSLAAGTDSNSAMLTGGSALRRQSLDKRLQSTVVGGDPKPVKPKLMTKSQCQAAALKGLNSGKLTASQCQHIDVSLSMDRRIDDATMATLRELHGGKW